MIPKKSTLFHHIDNTTSLCYHQLMNKFNQSKEKISKKSVSNLTKKALAGAALATSLLATSSELASAGEVTTQSSAVAIAHSLNEDGVAKNVIVMEGYELPIHYNKNSMDVQPMAIQNPIKLSKNTYAYIVDDPSDTTSAAKVKLNVVHYDKPLQVMKQYESSKEGTQEIVTSIASVYYPGTTSTGTPNYFNWVTIGDKPGDVRKLTNIDPQSAISSNSQMEQQILSMTYVGTLDYYAPRG